MVDAKCRGLGAIYANGWLIMVGASRTSPVPGSGMRRRHERRRTLPMFGALLGDNTPSPALRGLRMITKAQVIQWCSLSCALEVEGSRASSLLPLGWMLVLTGWEPFAWVPWGVYIGLPLRGTMVIWSGIGPGCQCLWSPASPPAAGARRLVGPAAWSGTEPTGRSRHSRVWLVDDHCSRAANDACLVSRVWL